MDRLRIADAGTLLIRALRLSAGSAGCPISIDTLTDRPWASTTFDGARHSVRLHAQDGPALNAWLHALPDADLPLRGYLVADCAVDADHSIDGERHVTLAVLTIAAT